jgi:hypothetical protein
MQFFLQEAVKSTTELIEEAIKAAEKGTDIANKTASSLKLIQHTRRSMTKSIDRRDFYYSHAL